MRSMQSCNITHNLVIPNEESPQETNTKYIVCRATNGDFSFLGQTKRKYSYENKCPSPDRSGNPFVAGFATKD
jgi:hypothetical protein